MRAGGLRSARSTATTARRRGHQSARLPARPDDHWAQPGQAQVAGLHRQRRRHGPRPRRPAPVLEVPIADPASLETLNFSQDPATGEPPPSPPPGATGSCTGTVTGSAARVRLAGRLREREGAPARAQGPPRVLAPGARPRDRRGLPGLVGEARRRQPADRALHRPPALRSHWSGKAGEERAAVRPLQRARGRRASATSGGSRCTAAAAASTSGARCCRRRG